MKSKTLLKISLLKKAPGHDKISNVILKNLPNPAIAYINNIYNSILRTGYFPIIWKNSEIIPVPKPHKNHNNTESYRPISLLPSLSKILEKIILKRINNHLNITQSIPKHQFINKLSTSHQLLRISEHIHTVFQNKQHTVATFLDISQAFDRVWHPGLIYKLKSIGTPNYLLQIIKSFITDRTFTVTVEKHVSNPRRIKAGLPKVPPFHPPFQPIYILYTSDIPTSPYTHIAQFADDTAIFMSHHSVSHICNKIQMHLKNIEDWSLKWKIKLNPSKSTAKIFSLRTFATPTPLQINNNTIPWTPYNQTVKYLGLNFDTRLTWKSHIATKIQQTTKSN